MVLKSSRVSSDSIAATLNDGRFFIAKYLPTFAKPGVSPIFRSIQPFAAKVVSIRSKDQKNGLKVARPAPSVFHDNGGTFHNYHRQDRIMVLTGFFGIIVKRGARVIFRCEWPSS